jgi:hypothetical protein
MLRRILLAIWHWLFPPPPQPKRRRRGKRPTLKTPSVIPLPADRPVKVRVGRSKMELPADAARQLNGKSPKEAAVIVKQHLRGMPRT